jgi:hypothetical protein
VILKIRRTSGCTQDSYQRPGVSSVTGIGTTVIIADNKSAPSHTVRPGLLFSGKTGAPAGGFVWTPEKAPKGPISVIVSAPDRKVYVYRNGVAKRPFRPRGSAHAIETALSPAVS